MKKTIYDLELHDTLIILSEINDTDGHVNSSDQLYVTRVPGGWIYRKSANSEDSVFVPFDKEFKPSKANNPKVLQSL